MSVHQVAQEILGEVHSQGVAAFGESAFALQTKVEPRDLVNQLEGFPHLLLHLARQPCQE